MNMIHTNYGFNSNMYSDSNMIETISKTEKTFYSHTHTSALTHMKATDGSTWRMFAKTRTTWSTISVLIVVFRIIQHWRHQRMNQWTKEELPGINDSYGEQSYDFLSLLPPRWLFVYFRASGAPGMGKP